MTYTLEQKQALAIAAARKRQAEAGASPTASAASPRKPQSDLAQYAGLAGNFAQGATGNFADEIGANIAKPVVWGLKNMLPGSMGGEDVSLEQVSDYIDNTVRPEVMRPVEQFAQEHPFVAGAAQAAGGIASAAGLSKLAAAAAPETASALAQFAKIHPYLAASGVGAGAGAIYGAGAGEGDLEARGESATLGGAAGGVLGPLAAFAGRQILAPLANRVSQGTSQAVKKFIPGIAASDSQLVPETAPKTISEVQKPSGEFFSKTKGERTQDPNIQALEADAVGGRFGDEAVSQMANARRVQNQERKAFIDAINPESSNSSSNVNDVLDGVYSRVQGAAKTLDERVDNAYKIARQGNSVNIKTGDIQNGLLAEIGRIRSEMGVNLLDKTNYSKANASLQALAQKFQSAKFSKVTALKLGDLEDWRKTLTNYANDATGSEKAFLSKVRGAYDDFMIKTANEAVDAGDAEAILAFRNAVGMRRKYGELFEKNKIVESIANGKTVDDFAKDLIGTGKIAGRKGLLDNARALVNAAEGEGDAVKADIAAAMAKRMYARATDGFEAGNPDQAFISPTKLVNELEDMFVKNRELAEYLYGKEAIVAARKAIPELRLIARKQPGTQNPSGSGQMIARILRNTGVTRIPGASLINDVLESSKKAAGQAKVESSLSEFLKEPTKPKSAFFSGAGGILGGVSGGKAVKENGNSKEPVLDVQKRERK